MLPSIFATFPDVSASGYGAMASATFGASRTVACSGCGAESLSEGFSLSETAGELAVSASAAVFGARAGADAVTAGPLPVVSTAPGPTIQARPAIERIGRMNLSFAVFAMNGFSGSL